MYCECLTVSNSTGETKLPFSAQFKRYARHSGTAAYKALSLAVNRGLLEPAILHALWNFGKCRKFVVSLN